MKQFDQQRAAPDEERNGLLEDFRALRQELLGVQSARLWGTLTYLAITGGVATVQTKFYHPSFFLFLMLAALPLIWHTANREQSRLRIAAYIKGVIEPRVPGLGWHAHLAEWRNVASGKTKLQNIVGRWRYVLALTGVYALIVIASFVLLLQSEGTLILKLSGLLVLALFVESHIYLDKVLNSAGTFEEIFRKTSQRLQELEKNQITSQST